MRRHFLDAMAICSQIGYPDFFITFTCNPSWPEIEEALQQQLGQCCLKVVPQVHGAGCSQQQQVRVVSTGNSLLSTKTIY